MTAAPAERREPQKGTKKWHREPGLALSFRKGIPVEGKIEQVIRGGYEVRVGRARGFCPHSQMDLLHVENPERFVGQTGRFRILQIRRGGEEVILSRRALLEEERVEEAKAVRATLIEGHVMQGHVVRTTDFGAFVDLGAGVTGLVHVSEIGHARVQRASDALRPGEVVQVRILRMDSATGRVSLSIRQAVDDPWENVSATYRAGDVHAGTVRRITEFGAFVEMAPGVEALAPQDNFPPGQTGWSDGLQVGESRSWRVVSVDPGRRRMSVCPAVDAEPKTIRAGTLLKGRVQKVERFGVFIWLAPGHVGLLPNALTGTKKGADLTKGFPVGKEIEVEILEADADGRRIRLAIPGAAPKPAAPREMARAHPGPKKEAVIPPPSPPQSFGTNLGDLMRDALKKPPG